jgi:hypothetical protein
MNRGQRLRQEPKRKPLLVNLSKDGEEVQFVQQIGPSGTRHTSRGASRGRSQGRGSNIGQVRPNFGVSQNKSLASSSHHLSSTRGRSLPRGQPAWPRGKPITNKKQSVVATMKVANNSNNDNWNSNNQGQEIKSHAPHSVALERTTVKVHSPSLEKGRFSRTGQMERRPIRPQGPNLDVAVRTSLPMTHNSNKPTKKEEEEEKEEKEEWGHPLDGLVCGVIHNARYWRRLERKVKADEEKRKKDEERRTLEEQERARNPPFCSKKVFSVSRNFLEDFSKLNFNNPSLPNS